MLYNNCIVNKNNNDCNFPYRVHFYNIALAKSNQNSYASLIGTRIESVKWLNTLRYVFSGNGEEWRNHTNTRLI